MIPRNETKTEVTNIQSSSYGEVVSSQLTPQVSGNAVYNFIPSNFRTFIDGGSAEASYNLFKVTSGTSLGNYGTIRSLRSVNYKTGQGAELRFCARFNNSEDLTWSGTGGINLGDELSFGYNGLNFGIWHRYGGKAEIRDLQITTPASGSENATITINSVAYVVPLTSGTVQKNAFEIEQYLLANGVGFEVEQINDIVRIDFITDGSKSGTYSFSSGTSVGSFSQVTAGLTKASDFYPKDTGIPEGVDAVGVNIKESWNGTSISSFDPSKGNTYSIRYHNGYGDMYFYIEGTNGKIKNVHMIKWTNKNTTPNLSNPSIHLGMYATSVGSTSSVQVECPYMAGFVSGPISPTRNPRAEDNTKSIGTTLTNILTLKCSRTYNGNHNQIEIHPKTITLTNDGNKGAIFQLRANPTVGGTTNFQQVEDNLVSQIDISGTTVSEDGRYLYSFAVGRLSSQTFSLEELNIRVPPSLNLVISGKMTSGSSSDLSATINWYEDI